MFWDIFVSLCNERGVSPHAVCQALGFSNATATHWKSGSVPRDTALQKIAAYFDVPVSALRGSSSRPVERGVQIPVLGLVAAGLPIEAVTDIEDYEEITRDMAASGEYVALRIHGDSMEPRMVEGDVVIVRLQETVESGDTAIVIVGNEATCKRVRKTPDGLLLISNNPAYEPMFYAHRDMAHLPLRIFGKVVELRAKFR